MNTKGISSALIAAGFFLGGVSPAYADFKTYAGSECEPFSAAEPDSFLAFSGRFNSSPADVLNLDCPAIHDRNVRVDSSWIRVIDRNPNEQVCAQFVAFEQIGGAIFSVTTPIQCTDNAFPSPNSVQLNTGGLAALPPIGAHYFFSVQSVPRLFGIDAASGVVTYFVNER